MKEKFTGETKKTKLKIFLEFFNCRNIFLILGISFIFFMSLRSATDPDMGWHLKDGEYLWEHNFEVAKKDIFSHTMPDFPLIMHEWVTDSIMWLIYSKLGIFSLSVFFALITTAAFVLVSFGLSAKREYKIIAAILGVIASVPILGVRPQMLNLLGLALVIFIIFRFRKNPKSGIIYFLPLIFFLWVNLHGGFAVGLFFLGFFLGMEILKNLFLILIGKAEKVKILSSLKNLIQIDVLSLKSVGKLAMVFSFSSLATLLNPYGWRMYIEVVTTIFDNYARQNIGEWMPVTIANPISYQFFVYLFLFGILLFFSFRKINWTYFIICLFFLYLGFSSWRHMPVFLIVSTPLWVGIVESLAGKELLKMVTKKWFLILMLMAVLVVAGKGWERSYKIGTIEKIAEAGNYPLGAINYLKQNPIEGNMFNEYNWGGFLIWQYPEKKTFIDGRMPSWKMGDFSIFREMNNTMAYNDGWDEIFGKYDIGFALVYNNPINKMMFLNNGWKEVYSDYLSIIFLRDRNK